MTEQALCWKKHWVGNSETSAIVLSLSRDLTVALGVPETTLDVSFLVCNGSRKLE